MGKLDINLVFFDMITRDLYCYSGTLDVGALDTVANLPGHMSTLQEEGSQKIGRREQERA